jgi:hypothetical protein
MKINIAKKWAKALRGGQYRKARHCLRNKRGFCCLGVLTDLYIKEHKKEWDYNLENKQYSFMRSYNFLPKEVVKWAGMRNEFGEFYVNKEKRISLYEENDKGKSFSEIADIIQDNVDKL